MPLFALFCHESCVDVTTEIPGVFDECATGFRVFATGVQVIFEWSDFCGKKSFLNEKEIEILPIFGNPVANLFDTV
jgi:hypothetical protein